MWIQRDIAPVLEAVAAERPAVLLTGARQTGKTALLGTAFPRHAYVSLDLPALAEQAEESGEQFLRDFPAPVIIDEVQYAPRLFRYLKHAIDQARNRAGQFLLTGSQKFALMQGVTESLAGRIGIVELHSLSLREIERYHGEPGEGERFYEWMFAGGYPELHARGLDTGRFYADYLATYLERDVRQVLEVRNLRDFDRFLRLAALRTGQLLGMNSLATSVGVSPTTIKSWLSVLEASNVIVLLPPYFENAGKRLVKTPKLYFLDTGLACHLAGLRTPADLRASGLLGALFETQALGQIIRWHTNRGLVPQVYFYRDHDGKEVDFLLPRGDALTLIECKLTETPTHAARLFDGVVARLPQGRVLRRVVLTPRRGARRSGDVEIDDVVGLACLGP